MSVVVHENGGIPSHRHRSAAFDLNAFARDVGLAALPVGRLYRDVEVVGNGQTAVVPEQNSRTVLHVIVFAFSFVGAEVFLVVVFFRSAARSRNGDGQTAVVVFGISVRRIFVRPEMNVFLFQHDVFCQRRSIAAAQQPRSRQRHGQQIEKSAFFQYGPVTIGKIAESIS